MDWEVFWNTNPKQFKEDDLFRQVGKTKKGEPISVKGLKQIIHQIIDHLKINKRDKIIDLCCGNGLITSRIADHCSTIIGIDYSEPLIKIAKNYSYKPNIEYIHSSVLNINYGKLFLSERNIKIYMNESLQHFDDCMLEELLKKILENLSYNPLIFISGVPDIKRILNFYNTPERVEKNKHKIENGMDDIIGTWWDFEVIEKIANDNGYNAEYLSQNENIPTHHYRYNVLLCPAGY